MTERADRLLAMAAQRASSNPAYLAWVFRRYEDMEDVSGTELARLLDVKLTAVAGLGLCLRPRPDHFAADVAAISARFDARADRLADVVRRVEAVQAMAGASSVDADQGMLIAARVRANRSGEPKDRRSGKPSGKRGRNDGRD